MKADLETIKAHCIVDDQGCWLWTGSVNYDGYAQIHVPGLNIGSRGHRITYFLTNHQLPKDMQVDHLCRNRRCVSPEHLELVTGAENVRRSDSITNVLASRTSCINGHELTETNTYYRRDGTRNCRECKRIRDRVRKARVRLERQQLGKESER